MNEDIEFKKSDFDFAGQERDLGKPKTKIYKRRKLIGLESEAPYFAQIEHWPALSVLLDAVAKDGGSKIFLAGGLGEMTREWMMEPLSQWWEFVKDFAFKHRMAVYSRWRDDKREEISIKLASHRESWFPGCEDQVVMCEAWRTLDSEWKSTGLPLLSSPATTGKALLWESLPCDKDGNAIEFPALPDDLAKLIRANSPQHRIEVLQRYPVDTNAEPFTIEPQGCIQYDGRWMYAAMCGLDRFPIGEPVRVGHFREYTPGWYKVRIRIPDNWNHVGLIPYLYSDKGWGYPNTPGYTIESWVAEPELTLALKKGWEIMDVLDGYAFEKGRPLALWSAKLIEMRESLQWTEAQYAEEGAFPGAYKWPYKFAAAAIRQILNHTIGAIHKNEFEREEFISDDNFRRWRREHPDLAESERYGAEKVEGGWLVPSFVPDTSRLSIFMPHWSSTIYSLARARVAEWALRCDPSTLVKIHGDAIYSTVEQPELDKLDDGKTLGRPRRK